MIFWKSWMDYFFSLKETILERVHILRVPKNVTLKKILLFIFAIYCQCNGKIKSKYNFCIDQFCSSEGTPDTLICGNCKELFSGIGDLLEHKQSFCKLRFVCKCKTNDSSKQHNKYTKKWNEKSDNS